MVVGTPEASEGLEVKPLIKELVYWERNGEILKNQDLAQQIQENLNQIEPIKVWMGKQERYGRFTYRAFVIDGVDGIVIVAEWNPAPGYSWEEYKIYILRF